MALSTGTIVSWNKKQIIEVMQNIENRKLDFGKEGYLSGKWNDAFGDNFEVIALDGVNILVDGHHRQYAIKEGMLTDLPDSFSVWLREADSREDIRTRQDALMENKRAPSAGQRRDIASKRVLLTDLKSKHAKAVGATAYKRLGFKGSDILIKGGVAYREELFTFDSWDFKYERAMYPQGILAAILSTIKIDSQLSKKFWNGVSNNESNKLIKKVRAKMVASGIGEQYNTECFTLATSMFDLWKDEQEEAMPVKETDEAFIERIADVITDPKATIEAGDLQRLYALKDAGFGDAVNKVEVYEQQLKANEASPEAPQGKKK